MPSFFTLITLFFRYTDDAQGLALFKGMNLFTDLLQGALARGNRAAVRKNVHEKVCSNMNMSRVPLN